MEIRRKGNVLLLVWGSEGKNPPDKENHYVLGSQFYGNF